MKARILGVLKIIAWLLLVVGVPMLIAEYWHRADKAKEDARIAAAEKERQVTRKLIGGFASSHNAIQNWKQGLSQFSVGQRIYSYQLGPVLLSYREKPILFIGELLDISEQEGKLTLHLDSIVNIGSHVRLDLESDSATISKISQHRRGSSEEGQLFAVIAEVDSVTSGSAGTPSDKDRHFTSVAQGRCIDVLYLGHYAGYYEDMLDTFRRESKP